MMLSILMHERAAPAPQIGEAESDAGDFEIVLGKRQIAGVLFLATVVMSVFAALAYVAGEAMSPHRAAAAPDPAPVQVAQMTPVPVVAAPKAEAPPRPAVAAPVPQAAVFADPKIGGLYLQMGAVDKGTALIFVEGLRTHGFESFAAPGPSEKIFRVLIGPLADPEAYKRTKDAVDDLGLTVFAKKYEQ